MQRLKSNQAYTPYVADVRGVGLLIGVELRTKTTTTSTNSASGDPPTNGNGLEAEDLAEQVMYACLSRGLSFKITMGRILTFCPPLVITEEQVDNALEIVEAAFEEVFD